MPAGTIAGTMKKWLACLVPWMAMTAACGQALNGSTPQPVKVDFTYQGVFYDQAVRVGDSCYASLDVAHKWGWNVDLRGDEVQVAGEGRLFRVPLYRYKGRNMLDLQEAARMLGAKAYWSQTGDIFQFRASIRNVEVTDSGVRVDSTLKVRPRAFRVNDGGSKLVVDFEGADLDTEQVKSLPNGLRAGQFSNDVVRIVIEGDAAASLSLPKFKDSRATEIKLPKAMVVALRSSQASPTNVTYHNPGVGGGQAQTTPAPTNSAADPLLVQEPKILSESDREVVISIPLSHPAVISPSVRYAGPKTLQVIIPQGTNASRGSWRINDSKLIRAGTLTGAPGTAVIIFETKVPLAFRVASKGTYVEIRLTKPSSAGKLSGKVIVIDPGHGGRDSGATGGGIAEKNLTLPLGQAVARELEKAGASVVLTRDQDVYIGLADRARTANQSNADLFVSIHINSNSVAGPSGTFTFYHSSDSTAILLAECIQSEIAKVSGLPSRGTRSDYVRFPGKGYAVLRESNMPAVLVEVGYIDNVNDRQVMISDGFRDKIAKAIVKGIRVFLGESNS